MASAGERSISVHRPTLAFWGIRSLALQGLLVVAAVALPVAAHLTGAPVRVLLPMHWPVILAGLVYGWRGGMLAGLLAPSASFALSGLPTPLILPAMTVELFCYGFITGLLRERFGWNPFVSVAVALVLGRIAFVIAVVLGGAVTANYLVYVKAAFLPGLAAAVGQVALLPLLGNWWVRQAQRGSEG